MQRAAAVHCNPFAYLSLGTTPCTTASPRARPTSTCPASPSPARTASGRRCSAAGSAARTSRRRSPTDTGTVPQLGRTGRGHGTAAISAHQTLALPSRIPPPRAVPIAPEACRTARRHRLQAPHAVLAATEGGRAAAAAPSTQAYQTRRIAARRSRWARASRGRMAARRSRCSQGEQGHQQPQKKECKAREKARGRAGRGYIGLRRLPRGRQIAIGKASRGRQIVIGNAAAR